MAKKFALTPLGDQVLIQRDQSEAKTQGGIIIPDTAKEKPQRGEVLAVGPGKLLDNGKRIKPEVKVGDSVIFGKYAGNDIMVDGVEVVMARADDIMAVVDG